MITLTFPDGSAREYKPGITGAELAASISKSLSKKAVAISLDGALADITDPIAKEASVKIVTRDDPKALELIRHDAAHVMAEAVQDLYPGTQVTIGPVVENGFYYDFFREESFTPDDLAKIDVLVVWQEWGPVRSEDRTSLILDAYKGREGTIAQALGVDTRKMPQRR